MEIFRGKSYSRWLQYCWRVYLYKRSMSYYLDWRKLEIAYVLYWIACFRFRLQMVGFQKCSIPYWNIEVKRLLVMATWSFFLAYIFLCINADSRVGDAYLLLKFITFFFFNQQSFHEFWGQSMLQIQILSQLSDYFEDETSCMAKLEWQFWRDKADHL